MTAVATAVMMTHMSGMLATALVDGRVGRCGAAGPVAHCRSTAGGG